MFANVQGVIIIYHQGRLTGGSVGVGADMRVARISTLGYRSLLAAAGRLVRAPKGCRDRGGIAGKG